METDPHFVQLLTKHQRPLYGYILVQLPHHAEAEDVLQQANLVLLKKAADFVPGTSFIAWACKVARYEILNHLRQRRRERQLIAPDDELLGQVACEAEEQAGASDERRSALHGCLQRINQRHRDLLQSFYGDEKSIDQIASESGRSVGGLRVTLHRVRQALLDCIQRSLGGARQP